MYLQQDCIRFPEVKAKLQWIKDERIIAKKNKEKSKDALWKLILNSYSGMLDNQYSWCYYPEGAMKMRIVGQLLLSKFIEEITSIGADLVSANTKQY